MANMMIIDDDMIIRALLTEHCTLLGHAATSAGTLEEGKRKLASQSVDLVFLDVRLPDGNGLEAIPFIQELPSSPEIIIITGMSDDDGAELAIKNGVWDYLQKPLSRQEIILHIQRALEFHAQKMLRSSNISLKRDEIIGKDKAISDCLDQVAHCARTEAGVLITGETGTGKEVFARAIHANSLRANGPFVVVDCASLPDNLLESILFGHAKGAFTGATSDKKGLIEQADGGTLFLDEVGELPLEAQKSFLRVLQERVFRPVGRDKEIKSNFRLLAATHRDLLAMVQKDEFRSDLYFRLNTFTIHLPPLRERGKDIENLSMNFVYTICCRNQLPIKGVLPETLEILASYHWPGNVRELENVLEKAIISDPENPVLYPINLPASIRLHHMQQATSQKPKPAPPLMASESLPGQISLPTDLPSLKEYRRIVYDHIEKQYLQRLISSTKRDVAAACKVSGLSRSRLYALLKSHSLTDPLDVHPEK